MKLSFSTRGRLNTPWAELTQLALENGFSGIEVYDAYKDTLLTGSASLRDAAGQMIENTAKSVRRKQVVDDAYFEKLYDDMKSLYRLDRVQAMSGEAEGKAELGPLPAAAKWLLGSLAAVWALILVYFVLQRTKSRKK